MKFRWIISSVLVVLAIYVMIGIRFGSRKENTTPLSYGIANIEEKWTMVKGNTVGAAIRFSNQDLYCYFSLGDKDGITIESLPAKSVGILYLKGREIKEGDRLTQDEWNSMILVPTTQVPGETEFLFSKTKGAEKYSCRIRYDNEPSEKSEGQDLVFQSYCNLKVFGDLSMEEEGLRYEVVRNCNCGVLTLDTESGTFCYQPKTDFEGTDRLYYRIWDEYGNISRVNAVTFQIRRAEDNLFFVDMKDKQTHSAAILVCEKGWMKYYENENSLPIFSSNLALSSIEFEQILSEYTKETTGKAVESIAMESSTKLDLSSAMEMFSSVVNIEKEETRKIFVDALNDYLSDTIQVQNGLSNQMILTREMCALILINAKDATISQK